MGLPVHAHRRDQRARSTTASFTGDLVVVGGGDPDDQRSRRRAHARVRPNGPAALQARGITRIDGRIVGDDNALRRRSALGEGWAWDDLALRAMPRPAARCSSTRTCVALIVKARRASPASEPPAPASSRKAAACSCRRPSSTTDAAQIARACASGGERSTGLVVTGTVPKAGRDYVRTALGGQPDAVLRHRAARHAGARGHRRHGSPRSTSTTTWQRHLPSAAPEGSASPTTRTCLHEHLSPPLAEIGATFMKVSQNLFGETLMSRGRAGARAQPRRTRPRAGRDARSTRHVLTSWGVPPGEFIVSDGSGPLALQLRDRRTRW